MFKKEILTVSVILIFFQQLLYCQTNQDTIFLQKIGALDSIYSNKLKESRKIYVQFPESYNPSDNQRYPVVYVLDGEVLLPTVSNVSNFYSGGFLPEMILIGISNSNNRVRDLTTSKVSEINGMTFNQENGGASNFINFIENELIPFVENKYPVTNFRTLIGHSYGGLFTIYTLLNHSHLFSNYVAIDPSLDWDNQKLVKEAQQKLLKNNYSGKSLFMSLAGQLHMQNPNITIENIMQDKSNFTLFSRSNITLSNIINQSSKNGLSYGWKFYKNDLHGTIPLPSIMDGLIFDFKWYQMENTHKFNNPVTPKEELLSIINHRTDKLKKHFGYAVPPYPEMLLNISGYMSLDMEQIEKSKMYFELAMKFYPESANVYDSMADFYERTGDIKNAIKYLNKALEINDNNSYKQRIKTLKEKI